MSSFEVAAQLGGVDASAALRPHLVALRRAARETALAGFPYPKLTFILRVDGEIQTFGPSGPQDVKVDRGGRDASVDITVSVADRRRLGPDDNVIVDGIRGSVEMLRQSTAGRLKAVDFGALAAALESLTARYLSYLPEHDTRLA